MVNRGVWEYESHSGKSEKSRLDPFGDPFVHFVSTHRWVTNIALADKNILSVTRNYLGRPLVITYHNHDLTTASYTNTFDASGRYLQFQMGPRGELVRGYGYHAVVTNLLTSVTNAVGDWIVYTHDTNTMKVVKVQFSSGLVRSNFYYPSGASKGFLEKQIELAGSTPIRTNSFTYDKGNILTQSDEMGLATTHTWDHLNRLLSTSYPDGTTVSNFYSRLDLVSVKNRLNQWTRYTYDAVGQLRGVTNANNAVTIYDYCGCGSPGGIIQSNGTRGLITSHAYDVLGRLTNSIYPDGYQVSRTYSQYDTWGVPQTISDSSGDSVSLLFGRFGPRFKLRSASFNTVQFFNLLFDEYGRATNKVDGNYVETEWGYDHAGRIVTRRLFSNDESEGAETFVYNARGLTNHFDPLGRLTAFVRDEAGRVLYQTNGISQTDPTRETLMFSYYPDDQLRTLTDGRGAQTLWTRDAYGQVTGKTLLANQGGAEVLRYYYDAEGQVTNRWSLWKGGSGANTYYTYDPAGNLTNVAYPAVALTNRYVFDKLNRLTGMTDPAGSSTFTWTDGGLLESEYGRWSSDTITLTNQHRKRRGLTITQPSGSWSQTYSYENNGLLSNITSPAGSFTHRFGESYNNNTKHNGPFLLTSIEVPGIALIRRDYDKLARLNFTDILDGGSTQLDYHSYLYDGGSQRTQHVFSIFFNHSDFTYDSLGQLKTAFSYDDPDIQRLHEQFGYAYDASGNLAWRTNRNLKVRFQSNGLNQLTNVSRTGTLTVAGTLAAPSTVTVSGTGLPLTGADLYGDGAWASTNTATLADGMNSFTASDGTNQQTITAFLPASLNFQYDGNGNLTNDCVRVFEYDLENQLTAVSVPAAWRSEFQYDGLGRRRIRKEYSWTGSAWNKTNEVRYIYDGRVVIQERDANNNPQVTYTRGLDLSGRRQGRACGVGGLLARSEGSSHAYYHSDGNGNVTCMLDGSGQVVARYRYDPYGNLLAMTGPLAAANLYRFSSKEFHSNSGFLYYLYRYYAPSLQRWVNADPIQEAGGFNLYRFVVNSPVSAVDPLGLGWIEVNENCKGKDLSKLTYQAERETPTDRDRRDGLREGRKPLRRLPLPGQRVSADSIYYPGEAMKIGNLSTVEIDCSTGAPIVRHSTPFFGFRIRGDGAIWRAGEPNPPVGNWPDNGPPLVNPIPPYISEPPIDPLPPLNPRRTPPPIDLPTQGY